MVAFSVKRLTVFPSFPQLLVSFLRKPLPPLKAKILHTNINITKLQSHYMALEYLQSISRIIP